MTYREEDFDAMYGKGMLVRVRNIINDLAPVTRRDEWWATDGPYDVIVMHLMRADGELTAEKPK